MPFAVESSHFKIPPLSIENAIEQVRSEGCLSRWEEGRERGKKKGKWVYLSQVKPVLCIAQKVPIQYSI